LDEFASAVALLSDIPDIGRRYRRASVPGLRRWLLSRSRYHVYYVHDEVAGEVVVLAVWSALRRRPPYITAPPAADDSST
jgi:plasmid stabilization system protein ParE